MKITIEKTFQGALRLTTIYKSHYFTFQYFDYTRKEAVSLFKQWVKDETK